MPLPHVTTGELITAGGHINAWIDDINELSPATSEVTTTGTITALPLPSGTGPLTIFMANASLATVQGITAGLAGQTLTLFSTGVGQVDLANDNAGASAANRVLNGVTGTISLAAGNGRVRLVYDARSTVLRWRVAEHDQGGWATYTPVFASSGTQPVLGNGTLLGRYVVSGRRVFYDISLIWGSTSTPGTGAWTFSTPFTAADANGQAGALYILDSGTQHFTGAVVINTTTTFSMATTNAANVSAGVPMTWATGDVLRITGFYVAA